MDMQGQSRALVPGGLDKEEYDRLRQLAQILRQKHKDELKQSRFASPVLLQVGLSGNHPTFYHCAFSGGFSIC